MGSGNGMLVISMFGTAVRLRKKGGSAKSQSKKGKKCNKVCKKYKTKSKLYK
jgi:thiamine monophosphate synthase